MDKTSNFWLERDAPRAASVSASVVPARRSANALCGSGRCAVSRGETSAETNFRLPSNGEFMWHTIVEEELGDDETSRG